ncbi:MAG TPA: TauD/TfdA family dioxygenase [Stellaceae bacterium]|nr:TauD/TfdA family dioxygenase [Stellaceae bacterium]
MDTRASPSPASLAIEGGGAGLTVTWADGRVSRFPALWLADNRPETRRGVEGQRLLDAIELPEQVLVRAADLTALGIAVRFDAFDGASMFDPAWLRQHALDPASRAERRGMPRLWDAGLAREPLPSADHATLCRDKQALRGWLRQVEQMGFALLHGVPTRPGAVCEVVSLFGYVRETNYGRLFDVVSMEEPQNLAFTVLALGNHTDNPYRDPVPQLQLLHCLEGAGEGGESIVVDGFAAAERLRREAPADFDLLTRTTVSFRYVEPGSVDLRHGAPLIELDVGGDLRTVRYNSRSIGPVDLEPDAVPSFYAAHRRFGRLLHDPTMTVGFRLGPGDLFIVDNRRVLHGRRGFGGGRRHLQGTYADADSLMSKLRVLEREA